jgi:membrane fusion protein, multidrug efflux system
MAVRKRVLPVVAAAAVLGLGAFGVHWFATGRFVEKTDNAYVQSDIAAIAPKVAGYVHEVRVRDNQKVRAGEVLAVIDDRDFAAQLAQAAAQTEAARAAIVSIESNLVLQHSMIAQAEAGIASAEADLRRAQLDQQRYGALAPEGFASRQRLETATADRQKADSTLARARAALKSEQDRIGVLEASRAQALAQLRQAEANEELKRIDLENTIVRAPFAGTVGNKGVELGQYVKAGTQLLSLVPDEIYVVANYKETQIRRMRIGQPVELDVDAYAGETLHGRIESLAPASGSQFALLPPENATGNFTKIVQRVPVRIAVSAEDAAKLRPGLSVIAFVNTKDHGNTQNADLRGAYVPPTRTANAAK